MLENEKITMGTETDCKGILDMLSAVVFRMSILDGDYEYCNPAVSAVFGYRKSDFLENPLFIKKIIHPNFQQDFDQKWEKLRQGEVPQSQEYKILDPGGQERWISQINTGVYDQEGRLIAVEGLCRDMTEQKNTEENMRHSEEVYRSLFEQSLDGIVVASGNKFVMVNDAFCNMLGYSREELLALDRSVETIHPEDREAFAEQMASVESGGPFEGPWISRVVRKDGSVLWIDANARKIEWEGKPARLSFLRDTTDRIEAEEALKRSEEAFRSLFEQNLDGIIINEGRKIVRVNKALCDLHGYTVNEMIGLERPTEHLIHPQDRIKIRKYMTAVESGEPVPDNIIVRGIRKDGSVLWVESRAKMIDWEGKPVRQSIVHDITDRVEAEEALKKSEENYRSLFENIADAVYIIDRETMTFLDCNKAATERLGYSREEYLTMTPPDLHYPEERKMLMNLAINAKDAMPEGGQLTIETRNVVLDRDFCRFHLGAKPGDHLLLAISDTGHGMAAGTIEHIFEPFYTTKGIGEGTGLGLAMVYGIVMNHGGYITCRSIVNQGTTFEIYLPVIEKMTEEKASESDHAKLVGGTETVLLVDDEQMLRDIGETILTKFGYRVITAPDGEQALDIFQQLHHNISLVILDLIMPGMGGKKCLKELLKVDTQTKVVIASGYKIDDEIKAQISEKAIGVISKPYNVAHMLKVVREVLDARDT